MGAVLAGDVALVTFSAQVARMTVPIMPRLPISATPVTAPSNPQPGEARSSERSALRRKPSRLAGSAYTARAQSMPVLSPSGMWGEAGPAVSSIETSGWQPRQTSWLMILNAELGWLLSLGRAPQATSGCAVAMHSCAVAVADQASTPATAPSQMLSP